jgi:membrane-associated protease RseP (regulator of RpoE activity)
VTRVEPGAPAAAAGVRVGDVLVELDHQPVDTPRDVEKLLLTSVGPSRESSVVTTVIRGQERKVIEVPLAAAAGREERATALRKAALVEELHRLRSEAEHLARRIEALERALALARGPGSPAP